MSKEKKRKKIKKKNHHILFQFGFLVFVLFDILILLNGFNLYVGAYIQIYDDEIENAFHESYSYADLYDNYPDNGPDDFMEQMIQGANLNLKATLSGPILAYYDEKTDAYYTEYNPDESLPFKPGDRLFFQRWFTGLENGEKNDLKAPQKNIVIVLYPEPLEIIAGVGYPVHKNGQYYGMVITFLDDKTINDKDLVKINVINIINVVIAFFLEGILLFIVYKKVLLPLSKVGNGLRHYTKDMDVEKLSDSMATVRSRNEIGRLADDISEMGKRIEDYSEENTEMVRKQTRITSELEMAANIQMSALPVNFPDKQSEKRFMLYASMNPAKEVGGDFYDFFMTDNDHIVLVIADVSDKGVPAALFMMNSKTLIQSHIKNGESPAVALDSVNKQLCENNRAVMFVTVWLAVIEISTGKGIAVNAGHENPAIYRKADNKWEILKYKHNPGIAVSKRARFTEHEFELNPGDAVYVYTDGVTDAKNLNGDFFGEEGLLEALNKTPDSNPEELLCGIFESIRIFSSEASQFDDITMLGFKLADRFDS